MSSLSQQPRWRQIPAEQVGDAAPFVSEDAEFEVTPPERTVGMRRISSHASFLAGAAGGPVAAAAAPSCRRSVKTRISTMKALGDAAEAVSEVSKFEVTPPKQSVGIRRISSHASFLVRAAGGVVVTAPSRRRRSYLAVHQETKEGGPEGEAKPGPTPKRRNSLGGSVGAILCDLLPDLHLDDEARASQWQERRADRRSSIESGSGGGGTPPASSSAAEISVAPAVDTLQTAAADGAENEAAERDQACYNGDDSDPVLDDSRFKVVDGMIILASMADDDGDNEGGGCWQTYVSGRLGRMVEG